MCGIAGFVQRSSPDERSLSRMLDRIAHRGPDGQGQSLHRAQGAGDEWSVHLGHRRLAIIDLAGGAQPMSSADGNHTITFNGEIYNFQSLRSDLQQRGKVFHSRSDTEVLLEHLHAHGPAALHQINGMFAFAQWDATAQTLTLARDRAGIKPLYYASLPDGGLAFASELLALLAHPSIKADIDPHGLRSYFFRDYALSPITLVRNVFTLEPGHFMTWHDGRLTMPQPFWKLSDDVQRQHAQSPTHALAPQELAHAVEQAVQSQLIADVPVGVFLSGGLDSSIVAAAARKHAGDGLTTFSIAFEDADFDESVYARLVAKHIGSRHVERRLSEKDLLDTLNPALSSLDEPMADPSILPTYVLSQLAAQSVKVALGGDGGDELWAGYPTYFAQRISAPYALLPASLRRAVIEPLIRALPVRHSYQSLEWKLKRLVLRWRTDAIERQQNWMSNIAADELSDAMSSDATSPFAPWPAQLGEHNTTDRINDLLALDFSTYMSGSVLTKVDRASMAHGLEVRPPLLDNTMIALAFAQPSSVKLHGSKGKWLLKQAALSSLPASIVHRKKKGFAIPLSRWIASSLGERIGAILRDSPAWDLNLLRRETFTRWHAEHRTGRVDRSRPLWALLVLDHWLRRVAR
jgi:asparagine synthase (glutamine-hydrolysing)